MSIHVLLIHSNNVHMRNEKQQTTYPVFCVSLSHPQGFVSSIQFMTNYHHYKRKRRKALFTIISKKTNMYKDAVIILKKIDCFSRFSP